MQHKRFETIDLFRPTPDQYELFTRLHREVFENRDAYIEPDLWVTENYAIGGDRVGTPHNKDNAAFMQLACCAEDLRLENPDLSACPREERLRLARRIVFVGFFLTNPDIAEIDHGFHSFEGLKWESRDSLFGYLARANYFDEPDTWMNLIRSAMHVLETDDATTLTTPQWNRDTKELRFRHRLCRKYGRNARNQWSVLDAFEDAGWPRRIDDPLKAIPGAKRRLNETIRDLNRKLDHIHFRGDGTGEGITWEADLR